MDTKCQPDLAELLDAFVLVIQYLWFTFSKFFFFVFFL